MYAFAILAGLVLIFSAGKVQAVCPADRILAGPCLQDNGALACPPDDYCNKNPDGLSGDCCSGTDPATGNNCVDLLSECPKNIGQCTVNSYRVFMTTNCPKTCNRCGVTNCVDAQTYCTQWAANGFCESTFYTTAQKQSYCRATCGYC